MFGVPVSALMSMAIVPAVVSGMMLVVALFIPNVANGVVGSVGVVPPVPAAKCPVPPVVLTATMLTSTAVASLGMPQSVWLPPWDAENVPATSTSGYAAPAVGLSNSLCEVVVS